MDWGERRKEVEFYTIYMSIKTKDKCLDDCMEGWLDGWVLAGQNTQAVAWWGHLGTVYGRKTPMVHWGTLERRSGVS